MQYGYTESDIAVLYCVLFNKYVLVVGRWTVRLIGRAVERGGRDIIILVFRYFLERLRKFTKILKHFLSLPTSELLSIFKATATESAIIIIITIIIIIIVIVSMAQQIWGA
jgi:hypothetical protein